MRLVAGLAGAGLIAAGCSSLPSTTPSGSTPGSFSPPPLATSVQTAGATWATIPMGRLSQPLNTFWQLFVLPTGSTRWLSANSVGVATNGGLVLSSTGGRTLVVGTRPANLLDFSAVASSSNEGRSWVPGLPVSSLTARVNALAVSPGGRLLALVGSGGNARILVAGPHSSGWATLVTGRALAAAPSLAACGPGALTAVAWSGTTPLVGAACRRPGAAGLLEESAGSWRLAGPPAGSPGGQGAGAVTVVGLLVRGSGVSVLTEDGSSSTGHLVAAFASRLGGTWAVTPQLGIGRGATLRSVGPDGRAGVFALWSSAGGRSLHAAVASGGASASWRPLPTAPQGTETLAVTPSGRTEAISASGSLLSVWALDSGSWRSVQRTSVPIQYGSSQ